MSKYDWIQIFTVVSTFLSGLAAWWSKRSNKQLQPRPGRQQRVQEAIEVAATGGTTKEVSIRDLVLGTLEETVALGERVTAIEGVPVIKEYLHIVED